MVPRLVIIYHQRWSMRINAELWASSNDTIPRNKPNLCNIPPELLSELFELGKRWEIERFADDEVQDQMPFELLVSQICSHTRRVALSTPRIWSSISINPLSIRERIAAYIARSASACLDLRMDMMQVLSAMEEKKMNILLDIVIPESNRWRRLSVLRLLELESQAIVRRICDCDAPSLQHLSLIVEQIDNVAAISPDGAHPFHIFKSTSQLGFLRLRGVALHLFRPPLDSVVVLHLDETRNIPLAYENFREIVLGSPYLAHLSIYGDIILPRSWCENDTPLPALLSLRICGVSGGVYAGILLSLDMLNLECLTLKRMHEHDLDVLGKFADGTKFSNLKYLKFWDFDVSVYTWERLIKVFRHITSFSTLHSGIFDSHLVELLLDRSGVADTAEIPLWPTLKVLSFPLCSDEIDVEVAEDLIKSRKLDKCPISDILLYADAEDGQEPTIESDVKGVNVVYTSRRDTWPTNFVEYDQDDIFLY